MSLKIRPMQADDLSKADHIFRLAFGTFIGLPDPLQFAGDAAYIAHRWKANPQGAFVAEANHDLIGSNLATCWGSVGLIGPITVHPGYWNQKVGQCLMEPVTEYFEQRQIKHAGLHTFSASPKHHALYQKFGFRLRFLTAIMMKQIRIPTEIRSENLFSKLTSAQQLEFLKASRDLTDSLYSGLDLTAEIQAVQAYQLGDTIALWNDQGLAGFAVCHVGAQTEAGSDTCYVKFAAVRSGVQAPRQFAQLLDLCEALTASSGQSRLIAGVNTSRDAAYQHLRSRGFQTEITGVAMHRPNEPGYSRPDVFAIDDWR